MLIAIGTAACGDKTTDAAASSTAAGTTAPATSSTSAALSAAASATAAETASIAPGSVTELRKNAAGVMAALKGGDAKAAADFCLGKHRDGLEKYIAEAIGKKEQSRAKGFAAYDGKLGEIRVDGDQARVAYFEDGGSIDYLEFRKKDGTWSLFDLPVKPKKTWEGWGKVVTE